MEADQRTLYCVVVEAKGDTGTVRHTMTFRDALDEKLETVVRGALGSDLFFRSQREGHSREQYEAEVKALTDRESSNISIYDYHGNALDKENAIRSLPPPGVLVVVDQEGEYTLPRSMIVNAAIYYLKNDHRSFQQYLASADAQVKASQSSTYDVFVSYSHQDEPVAKEIHDLLRKKDLRTFLADRTIDAASLWSDAIRDALRGSKLAVIILTPKSVGSQWVMCEAGAFWALNKPILPAMMYVGRDELPGPISQYQGIVIETTAGRKRLAKAVAEISSKIK